jgi:hypothetical protein
MGYDITLLLDGLILIFLCVTIFYAARLSLFMKNFRQGKSEMQRLVRELNSVIVRAENAVVSMKEHAGAVEGGMREAINEAKFLSDELKFMNETGDGLADRLEQLADRNRELVDLMENPSEPEQVVERAREQIRTFDLDQVEERIPTDLERTFNIQDFDLDAVELDEDDEFDFLALSDGAYREEDALAGEEHYSPSPPEHKMRNFTIFDRDYTDEEDSYEEDVSEEGEPDFYSRAEQELFEALQRKKRVFDERYSDNDDYDDMESSLESELETELESDFESHLDHTLGHRRVSKLS